MEKLLTDVAAEVVDLLDHMPEDKPYDTLKQCHYKMYGYIGWKKLHDLFNNLTLVHMKPSQLLRKMKSLLGSSTMSETVKKNYGWTNSTHIQRKYSPFSRELLAIYLSIRHFCHRLEGQDFTVFTDHKPLTYALHVNTDKYAP